VNRDAYLQRLWYERRPRWLLVLLLPLSALFAVLVQIRRCAYRCGLLAARRVSRPVIVVGNISVGGTGKTPLVMWLAELLQSRGQRVGIVTRGYGGSSAVWPREVTATSSPLEVGDEPVMMAIRTGAIVVAGPDRVAAANLAIEKGAHVILSDDGLQHYRLQRDGEIAVIDAQRGLGNGLLLPAGPLREPAARLKSVDLLVRTQRVFAAAPATGSLATRSVTARMSLVDAVPVGGGERCSLDVFKGRALHAVAAVGNPQAFFTTLRQLGLQIDAHALPDHATLTSQDISFGDDAPVLMTEKDAVKCRAFADQRHWAVRMDLELSDSDRAAVAAIIEQLLQRFLSAS
jgi:tetraacyldisaccharide 4'-kinase